MPSPRNCSKATYDAKKEDEAKITDLKTDRKVRIVNTSLVVLQVTQ